LHNSIDYNNLKVSIFLIGFSDSCLIKFNCLDQ